MKIGLASYKFINNNLSFNISKIEKALKVSSTLNIDMLCFGEAFLQGFDSLSWNYEKDLEIAVTQNSEIINKIIALSKQYNIDLAFGYIEKDNEFIYSSYMIIINGKKTYNYRRISKGWKEVSQTDYHYQEGSQVLSFNYKKRHITISLCGDVWEEPKLFKCNDILLWPVYVDFSLSEWKEYEEEYALQASLVANKTLMVNSLCDEPQALGNAFYFLNGKVNKSLLYNKEDILIINFE